MCLMLNTYFKDISQLDKKKLIYEPGTNIYDKMLWPPIETKEYVRTKKESLGVVISFIDFLTILSLMVFIKCLKKS